MKKSYSPLLLVLLVITGFAGTIKTDSITYKERKISKKLMILTRNEVINFYKHLKAENLESVSTINQKSIQNNLISLASEEKQLWMILEKNLACKTNLTADYETKYTDQQLISTIQNQKADYGVAQWFGLKTLKYKSVKSAMIDFKNQRNNHLKYMRHTTEALRSHVIKTMIGNIDCYQLSLIISEQSDWYLKNMKAAKQ